ncbi:MAG: hypothetical protein ACI4Q9_04000 [Candidatus Methanomethylophilaceae archaeon]
MYALIGALAVVCVFGLIAVSDDSSAMSFELKGDDFAKAESSVSFTLDYDDTVSGYKYTSKLVDGNGNDMSAVTSGSTGTIYATTGEKSITVKVPKANGDYRLIVTITDADGNFLAERVAPIRSVDPVVLSATLKNEADAKRVLTVYFYVNGVKMEDSKQADIEIPANGTKTITYDYLVKDLTDTTFYLVSDDSPMAGQISGLGPEHSHTFYVAQNSYTLIEVIAVITLIVIIALAVYVYRKPIKNYGKPKARR